MAANSHRRSPRHSRGTCRHFGDHCRPFREPCRPFFEKYLPRPHMTIVIATPTALPSPGATLLKIDRTGGFLIISSHILHVCATVAFGRVHTSGASGSDDWILRIGCECTCTSTTLVHYYVFRAVSRFHTSNEPVPEVGYHFWTFYKINGSFYIVRSSGPMGPRSTAKSSGKSP